ncbi:hypothetical protein O181_114893 [Austropuccinia psidii MF-1]|uniref:Uncharacterized protein n=1 Tax=Austropuccinia psidii MF-1 TaxID=1389203 RepID=A0A9Q3PUZ9_9BASI|nr:hypothetical protein [Austropuccinia psidii MF-1]
MLEEHVVPPKPKNSLLKEFNQPFSTNEQLQNAATSQTGGNLITKKEVQTLRDACAGHKKVGKHIVYLENFYFLYICSLLSKLGIRVWAPDLEEAPGFLYNAACRTVAIMNFRQLACSGAYQFMQANLKYLNNISLLHRTYDHFVHYLMSERYKKKIKEAWKNLDEDQKRLAQRRYKFAVANDYPNRYLNVIKDINSHSDDEFFPEFKAYATKELLYCSDTANVFFRNLDRQMKENNKIFGKSAPLCPQCQPIIPIFSASTKVPRNMPLDFYPPDWLNKLNYAQRFSIANARKVAFVPLSIVEMSNKIHTDENLRDKAFNEKYWEAVTQPYDLSHEGAESSDNNDDENSEENEYSNGDIIDLRNGEID